MKKIILLFLLSLVLLSSCKRNQYQPQYKTVEDTLAIEQFVDTFVKAHPNLLNNDATKEDANKEFAKLIKDTLKKVDLIKGIPVQLVTVNKNGGKYIAQFRAELPPDYFKYFQPIYTINFDIIGVVSKEVASSLKEDTNYSVGVKYISHLDGIEMMEVLLGTETTAYTNEVGIEPSDITYKTEPENLEIDLGLMYVDFTSINGFKGRHKIRALINPKPEEAQK